MHNLDKQKAAQIRQTLAASGGQTLRKTTMTRIITLIFLFALTSCQKKANLTFMLLNESPDNKEIKLQVKVGDIEVFNDKLNYDRDKRAYLGIKTDFPIGKYMLYVSVDSIIKTHPVMVDTDKLVFINYKFNALDTIIETIPFEGDSITIKRTADLKDAKLDIQITEDTGP